MGYTKQLDTPMTSAPRPVVQVNTFAVDRCLMISDLMNRALGRTGTGEAADAATVVSSMR